MNNLCWFQYTHYSQNLITCGARRIDTIKECSVKRGDGIFNLLNGVVCIVQMPKRLWLHKYLKNT